MRSDDVVAARDADRRRPIEDKTRTEITATHSLRRTSSADQDDSTLSGWVFVGITVAIVGLVGVLLWLVGSDAPGTTDVSESSDISLDDRVPNTISAGQAKSQVRPRATPKVEPGMRPLAGSVPATIAIGTNTSVAPTTVAPQPRPTATGVPSSAGQARSKAIATTTAPATSTTRATATTVRRSTTTVKPQPVTEVRSTAVTGLRPPDAERPPSGICGAAAGNSEVTFRPSRLPGGSPRPKCAQATGTERIRLVNDGATPWLVRLGRLDVTILPGDSHVDTVPVGTFLAPGFHTGTGLGSLWLLPGTDTRDQRTRTHEAVIATDACGLGGPASYEAAPAPAVADSSAVVLVSIGTQKFAVVRCGVTDKNPEMRVFALADTDPVGLRPVEIDWYQPGRDPAAASVVQIPGTVAIQPTTASLVVDHQLGGGADCGWRQENLWDGARFVLTSVAGDLACDGVEIRPWPRIWPAPKCPRVENPADGRELTSAVADVDGDGESDRIRYLWRPDGSALVIVDLGDGGSLAGRIELSILPNFVASLAPIVGARDLDADGTLEVFATVGWDGVEQVDIILRREGCALRPIPNAPQLPRLSSAGSTASYRCIPGGIVIIRADGSPGLANFDVVRAIHDIGAGGFVHRSTESATNATADFPGPQLGEPCF